MWALEYEVDELQHKFADSIGKMDLDNLDVDFIEDMMLKAKPLQTVLNCIRNRQIVSIPFKTFKAGAVSKTQLLSQTLKALVSI